jgi:3-keto-5-aminohexanoate cleavage enzyme
MKHAPAPQLVVNFAPTGMVPTKADTPHVPLSPAEIIEQVHEAYEIGISVVHLHARRPDGSPGYEPEIYAEMFAGVRRHCPDLPICASLSGRTFREFEERSAVLELRPDMGSLTLGSLNFVREASLNAPDMILRLIEAMNRYGVVPELECFDAGMINYANHLIAKGILRPPHYFNVIVGNIFGAQADLLQVGTLLRSLPAGAVWSLGGIGAAQLKANALAISEGGGVRVGLEDNIWFDAGRTRLATNIELLRRIHDLAAIFNRPVMNPATFRGLGFSNNGRITASS